MWCEQMKKRCPSHRKIGTGVLRQYRWIISARGYANIVKSESDYVEGVIYKITESDERRLDRYEGVQSGVYIKEVIPIEIDGESRECLVYIDPDNDEGKPKHEYIGRINKAISRSELSPEYVSRYLRKFIPA